MGLSCYLAAAGRSKFAKRDKCALALCFEIISPILQVRHRHDSVCGRLEDETNGH